MHISSGTKDRGRGTSPRQYGRCSSYEHASSETQGGDPSGEVSENVGDETSDLCYAADQGAQIRFSRYREVNCEGEAGDISGREWQPFLGQKVFKVGDGTDQNCEAKHHQDATKAKCQREFSGSYWNEWRRQKGDRETDCGSQ